MAFIGDDDCDVHMPPKDLVSFDMRDEEALDEDTPVLTLSEYHKLASSEYTKYAKSKIEELYQYVQTIEKEKETLELEIVRWKEREAKIRSTNVALAKRVNELQQSLTMVLQQREALQKQLFDDITRSAGKELENEHITMLQTQINVLQLTLDEAERARQAAVYKISELSIGGSNDMTTKEEWAAKFKHDYELLLQRSMLNLTQQQERHNVALDIALRKLKLEHAAKIEKLTLAHEIKLTEWRLDEARRGKEIESAMEADRYSARLEMKHHIQNAHIHQKIAITPQHQKSQDDSIVVRLSLDALRGRRMDALKKMCLIRNAFWRQALHQKWYHWQHVTFKATWRREEAQRQLYRCVLRRVMKTTAIAFQTWRSSVITSNQQGLHTTVMQQVLSGERILQWVLSRWRRRIFVAFWKWKSYNLIKPTNDSTQLKKEITKLHEELAKTKAETWRCKRQLLQQFKQSAM
ncbi:hypothetical protein THRCLA_11555 [Thraustotheca clavata]|uniref:Uncharacterized protein n=1 Tax=Thraustotheca clavata TaxID=74557 RepID=A0A1V9Y7C2_9STRA|nr:hypothetical protein THRCLA_11555 [Thraustotheca clavata]